MKSNTLAMSTIALLMLNFSSAFADQESINADIASRTPEKKGQSLEILSKIKPFEGSFVLVSQESTPSIYCHKQLVTFPEDIGNDKFGNPRLVIRLQTTNEYGQDVAVDSFLAGNDKKEMLLSKNNGSVSSNDGGTKTEYNLFTDTRFATGTTETGHLFLLPFSYKDERSLKLIGTKGLLYSKLDSSYSKTVPEFECLYTRVSDKIKD